MVGFVITGKAFCVCEELRIMAEQNKGATVLEMLRIQQIKQAEAMQLGVSVEEFEKQLYGGCINGTI